MNEERKLLAVQYFALTFAVWGLGAVFLYFVFTDRIIAMAVTFVVLFACAWPMPRLLRQLVAANRSRMQAGERLGDRP